MASEKNASAIRFVDFTQFFEFRESERLREIDILHLGSVLQYMDDWRSDILKL